MLAPYISLEYSKIKIILMVSEINPQDFTRPYFDSPDARSLILIQQVCIEHLL